MAQAQSAAQIWADSLCCLGLGVLVACLYSAACLFLGRSRPAIFFLDQLAFVLAGVLLFGYGASRSWAGSVRGYMAAGMLAGCAAWFGAAGPFFKAAEKGIKWILSRPFALALWLVWPLAAKIWGLWKDFCKKILEKRERKRRKQLQKNKKILYNSN